MFGELGSGYGEERAEGKLGKDKYDGDWGEMENVVQVGRYPCEVCGRGVGANSVLCRTCGKWCHRRCWGLRSLSAAVVAHFQCPACARWVLGELLVWVVMPFGGKAVLLSLGCVVLRGGGGGLWVQREQIRARVGQHRESGLKYQAFW